MKTPAFVRYLNDADCARMELPEDGKLHALELFADGTWSIASFDTLPEYRDRLGPHPKVLR